VAIYAEVAGEGPSLVLVHEGICDSRMWDEQWERYAESFRVLRLDLRGFGQSPLEPGPFAHARDVIETLERHGFESIALVGVSLGGRVALEVALARPELVSALVLVAPGFPGHEWSDELRAQWAKEGEAFEAGDLDGAVEVSLRTWVDGPRRSPEQVDPAVRAKVAEMQRRAYELQRDIPEDEEELLVEDLPQRLGDVQAPTLVLVGEEDQPDMHAIAERLAREIPGARSGTIPGTAHVPSMERPREFDELVLPFLRESA
jgi:3-oxoadipate enol-lactonase